MFRNARRSVRRLAGPLSLVALVALTGQPVAATDPICTPDALPPGTNHCLPTPVECATGRFNGHWDGGAPGRFVDCLGGAGHVAYYVGGNVGELCGVAIEADQVVASTTGWLDPNVCRPESAPAGYGARGRAFRPAVESAGGVVASVSPQASAAGIEVLEAGGNAIDAAVATVLAVGVARPEFCGIGGGGFLVYRGASGHVATLDFRETAPAAVTPQTKQGSGIHSSLVAGHRMVGVPGVIDGMAKALDRFGTTTLAEAIAPAERLAREGVPVSTGFSSQYAHAGETNQARLAMFPETARIYLRNGRQYPPDNELADSTLVQTEYARSLALIARYGPDAFYQDRVYPEGESIARLIVRDMENPANPPYPGDEGLMTMEDLASYEAIWRKPLKGTYRGHQVITMGPPTGGGIMTLETLNILEGYDLASMGHSSADHLHLVAEAHKIAWADRVRYAADPAFADVPGFLTTKGYAAERRTEIDLGRAGAYAPVGESASRPGRSAQGDGGHTTHVSVIDAAGNAVAVTCTLVSAFGSAVVAPGTGFLLNNQMANFSGPGTADQPEGGKRAAGQISPVIVVKGGRPVLVAGAAGGSMIPISVILAISGVVDFGMDVAHAVDAARVFEFVCCEMTLESSRVLPEVIEDLRGRGHVVTEGAEYLLVLPTVEAAGVDPETGLHVAVSDVREDWGALGQG